MRKLFSTAAITVLTIGLFVNATIILFSFSAFSQFYPAVAVKSVEQAKEIADRYVARFGSDLRTKEIMEFSNHFYVMIQEKSTEMNTLELLVDKITGRIFYEPGPNMMWNTKYGHMGQMRETAASMSINAREASEYAQRWLDRNVPSANVEEPETFYGYYTIDLSKNGQILGMLSVNGYTGEVWYHTWHGQFIEMIEYE